MEHAALITGASRGIGLAFAELLAQLKYNLLLVARNQDRLILVQKRLQNDFDVKVDILSLDLSLASSSQELIDFAQKKRIGIEIVINNAAFGYCGEYSNLSWYQEMRMIHLNIISSVHLTKYFLNEMIERNSGSIINVVSTAAFSAGPYMSSYVASKAYLLSYTESLSEEIKRSRVRLMALCPGPTRTDFHHQSGMPVSNAELRRMPTAREVAVYGWRLLQKNKAVVIYGWPNKILVGLAKFLPRSLVRSTMAIIKQKKLNLSRRKRRVCLFDSD